MNELIGFTGLILLIIAYVFYGVFHDVKKFTITNTIATLLLTLYAILNKDVVFILVNGFILIMLIKKLIYIESREIRGENEQNQS